MHHLSQAWDDRIEGLLARLPERVGSGIRWLRAPSRRIVRTLAAVALVLGGVLSILPVLGIWMLPLGLALLAEDVPGLKGPLERGARSLERAWRRRPWRRSARRREADRPGPLTPP